MSELVRIVVGAVVVTGLGVLVLATAACIGGIRARRRASSYDYEAGAWKEGA